jgi:hypothetical protein
LANAESNPHFLTIISEYATLHACWGVYADIINIFDFMKAFRKE